MTVKISSRGRQVSPFIVMEVLRQANRRAVSGKDVLHLELGQPSEGPPAPVLAAAARALESGRFGYTEEAGYPELRQRIARHYGEFYDLDLSPDRVIVTTGSSGALMLAFLAAFDPGDRVALVTPNYPGARNALITLGLEPVLLEAGPAENFQPTVALLEAVGEPIQGLMVTSPGNPSGTVIAPHEMAALAAYCRDKGIRLISDEIYHGITYEAAAATAAALSDEAIVINSFSKYFTMTGWRLGWMVVPEDLVAPICRLIQNFYISPPTLSQDAALAVFDCRAELDGIVAGYRERRDLLLRELPKAGFNKFAAPQGAFYLYADVSNLTNDSVAFCERILNETGVAIVPGVDFDRERGQAYVRFSFSTSLEVVAGAVSRLIDWQKP